MHRCTDERYSITRRLTPFGVNTISNDLLTLGIGQAASLLVIFTPLTISLLPHAGHLLSTMVTRLVARTLLLVPFVLRPQCFLSTRLLRTNTRSL